MELAMKTSLVIRRILMTLGALAIIFLVFAFVTTEPGSRQGANASFAASSLRRILSSNDVYAEKHPQQGYARNLNDLANRPSNAKAGEDPGWMIDPALASGEKAGYKFTYRSQSTKGDGKIDAFQVTADPLEPGKTGIHHLFVDQTGVFRVSKNGAADSSSDVLQ